jgi:hypothetical protein
MDKLKVLQIFVCKNIFPEFRGIEPVNPPNYGPDYFYLIIIQYFKILCHYAGQIFAFISAGKRSYKHEQI